MGSAAASVVYTCEYVTSMADVELLFRGPSREDQASRVEQLCENTSLIWSTQGDIDWPGWKQEDNSNIELL